MSPSSTTSAQWRSATRWTALAAVLVLSATLLSPVSPAAAAPPAATLVSPGDGAVAQTAQPALSVAVSDPDGDPLQVTFEGRLKGATVPGPTTAEPFTLVAIPDIQNYTNAARAPIIAQQAQWIVDTRASLNTQFAVQLGDLVGTWSFPGHWPYASNGLKVLDDNGMPNAVVPGNHDWDYVNDDFSQYNTWFPPSRYQNASWTPATARYGGYMGQNQFGPDASDRKNMNNYSLFTAGGVDWLVLGLEWEAPASVLEWADRVLAAHPDRQVIMFTHAFVNIPGARRTFTQRPGGTPPETTWGSFVRTHCQIRLVLNGHEHAGDLGEARRTDPNACGQPVHQILSDYQERANGGNGWLRYYRLDPAAATITAVTYSPYLNQYETDADSSFTLPFPLAPAEPAPFVPIATVSAASGTTASTTMSGAAADTAYEWRVRVDDGSSTVISPTWTVRSPAESGVLGRDLFERSGTNGWGTADVGGAWSITGSLSAFRLAGGAGLITSTTSTAQRASLPTVSSTRTRISTTFSVDKVAEAHYLMLIGRQVDASQYLLRVRIGANGSATLHVMRGGTAIGAAVPVTGLVMTPGASYSAVFDVSGTSPTTLSGKLWRAGTAEPATWQVVRTDSTAALQAPGSVGLQSQVPSAANAFPLVASFSEIRVTDPSVTGPQPNQAPVAAFTSSASGLALAVDGASSSDPDGSVASYVWDFGDGTTASGPTASRTYATAGTYTVTLTVTDDEGATNVKSAQVTVTSPPPNQAPVAAFTSSASGLALAVDGAASSDPDGSVASYVWDFGDGTTASGPTASRTYATAGTYTVTLTVTDDEGATNVKSAQVTVTSPPPGPSVLGSDRFERTVVYGWGTADTGGAWSVTGSASSFKVTGGAGVVTTATSTGQRANLASVSSTRTRLATVFSVDKVAEAHYISLIGRQVGANQYLLRVRIGANGSVVLHVMRGGTAIGSAVTPAGVTMVSGASYNAMFEVTGTSPTTLSGKLWRVGTPEPTTWQAVRTDSTAALQAPGSVGVQSQVPTAANAFPLATSFSEIVFTAVPLP